MDMRCKICPSNQVSVSPSFSCVITPCYNKKLTIDSESHSNGLTAYIFDTNVVDVASIRLRRQVHLVSLRVFGHEDRHQCYIICIFETYFPKNLHSSDVFHSCHISTHQTISFFLGRESKNSRTACMRIFSYQHSQICPQFL